MVALCSAVVQPDCGVGDIVRTGNLHHMAIPPLVAPGPELTTEQKARYARHILLPEIGIEGQRRLANARVLVVGAGGLGSPALMYLAAAGVGTIGVVDDDVVDASNLQRQVVHGDRRRGPAQDRVGRGDRGGDQPARHRGPPRPAAHLRERARDPRRLRRGPRRRRQLPDPLPRQRRLRLPRAAARVGVDLPLRRPGLGVVRRLRPLLPLRLPRPAAARRGAVVRDRWRARRAVRGDRVGPGRRGRETHCGTRRTARRAPPRARRAAPDLGLAHRARRPRLPRVRRVPDRHLPRRLRAVLRYAGCFRRRARPGGRGSRWRRAPAFAEVSATELAAMLAAREQRRRASSSWSTSASRGSGRSCRSPAPGRSTWTGSGTGRPRTSCRAAYPSSLLCKSGVRSAEAAGLLAATGRGDVANLTGGVLAWVATSTRACRSTEGRGDGHAGRTGQWCPERVRRRRARGGRHDPRGHGDDVWRHRRAARAWWGARRRAT